MRRLAGFLHSLIVLALALGPTWSGPAFAHTRSESHSAWLIKGNMVHLQFTVPDLESKRITPDDEMPSVEQLGDYIAQHVGAFSGDAACKRTEGPRAVATASGYRRYEFAFECPSDDDIKINDSA